MTRFSNCVLALTVATLSACGGGSGSTNSVLDNIEPAIAPALPATEVANAAANVPLSATDAFRLLDQGTFGPQLSEISALTDTPPEAWIDAEMQKPATFMLPTVAAGRNDRWYEYVNSWWRMTIQADDQLRQRVAFALSEILVVSANDGLGNEQAGLATYYDTLLRHAFGNYRDLLQEVTLSPIMGDYLSMKGNQKHDPERNIRPDENYARELLQLFTIGLVQLNADGTPQLGDDGVPLPTYDQTVVEEFARVFTGWHFDNAEDFRWARNQDYITPMRAFPEYHDMGSKQLLNGVVLPAGQTPEADLTAALDNVFQHPNVGPFISRQLIQRLVTSNPSPQYVEDVAAVFNSNVNGERGSLASTVKAILMHREAREGHLDEPDTFGKVKEPLLRMTHLWRAFEPERIHRDFNYAWVSSELGQGPLNSPTVFNFFRPDYSQPGAIRDRGLVSPELSLIDERIAVTLTSRLLGSAIWSHNYKNDTGSRIAIDISHEMQLEPDQDALLDHLDLVLLGGRMTPALREEVRSVMNERNYSNGASQRVVEAIFLIISSPEAAVQL